MIQIGVVGSGIGGLVCASRLLRLLGSADCSVTVLEWGRGPGGRTARRRVRAHGKGSELSFDHGCPFFTAQTTEFRSILHEWKTAGLVSEWNGTFRTGSSPTELETDRTERWVGVPSNHAVAKSLAGDVESAGGSVLYGRHVRSAEYGGRRWIVNLTNRFAEAGSSPDEQLSFDALVLSDKLLVLPNQYCVLSPPYVGSLALPPQLSSTGNIVLMVAFSQPLATDLDVVTLPNHSILSLIVRDSAKPGRDQSTGTEQWVAHSTESYALRHLVGEAVDNEQDVLEEMQAALLSFLGTPVTRAVAHAGLFAWDHAQPRRGGRVAGSMIWEPARRAGLIGDFFHGDQDIAGVEAAVLSGCSLADALAAACLKSDL